MKGQKDSVVELVKQYLPTFVPYKDLALVMLSKDQLESIKETVARGILSGSIDYGKDRQNRHEVFAYARSMTMNHLKKARELNGNQVYGKTQGMVESSKLEKRLLNVDINTLPDDLKTYVRKLV